MEVETQEQTKPQVKAGLSQVDAVYNFTIEALSNKPATGQKLKELVTKDVRKVVRTKLFAAIRSGEVKLRPQYDDSKLKKYCSGLINNWLKKDPRFN